ncbi:MAG: flippase [archaeon]
MKKNKTENKELNKSLNLLAKSSVIVFIGIFLSKLLAYIYRIIIARYFGPEVYGIFSLALMIVGWFTIFSALGLSEGIVRYISLYRGEGNKNKIRYIFRYTLKFLVVSGIISGVLLFILADFISVNIFRNIELSVFLKFFSISIPFSILSYIFLSYLRAYEEIGWYSFIYNIVQNATKVLFIALLIFIGLKSDSIIFSYVLGMVFMFLFSYFVCKYKLPEIFFPVKLSIQDKKIVSKKLLDYSIPIMFFGVVYIVFTWIDSFSIGFFKGALEVGYYNAAVPIALLISLAPELFFQLFFPLITKEYSKKNLNIIKELSKQVAKWVFILNLPLFILIFLFPGAAINILFGPEYLVAIDALRILSISTLFASVFLVSHQLVSMTGRSKLILLNIILASLINIVLNYFLVPMQKILFLENSTGITGAALSTMISIIFLNTLFFLQARHYLSIVPLRRKMINIIVAAIIPTILLMYFRKLVEIKFLSLIILSVFFILTYLVLIFLTRSLDKNDFLVLKSLNPLVLKK